jgi:hypothetical protein
MKGIYMCAESEGLCDMRALSETRKNGDPQVMAREGKVKMVNARA